MLRLPVFETLGESLGWSVDSLLSKFVNLSDKDQKLLREGSVLPSGITPDDMMKINCVLSGVLLVSGFLQPKTMSSHFDSLNDDVPLDQLLTSRSGCVTNSGESASTTKGNSIYFQTI